MCRLDIEEYFNKVDRGEIEEKKEKSIEKGLFESGVRQGEEGPTMQEEEKKEKKEKKKPNQMISNTNQKSGNRGAKKSSKTSGFEKVEKNNPYLPKK